VLFVAGLMSAGACSGNDTETPVDPVSSASTSGPLARRLAQEFDRHYKQAQGMSYTALLGRHQQSYLKGPSFKVPSAAHYKDFVSTFALSTKAVQTLDARGFVVVPSPGAAQGTGAGPADIYYRVFAADLPVFISADSILHAWHRTFDKILEVTEENQLSKTLTQMMSRTMGALDPKQPAQQDALFYLAVARSLLDGSVAPAAVKSEVDRYLKLIEDRGLARVEFMGVETDIDFSQFIPRGHYTNSETLKKYFLAMMWLGRTDLVLYDPNPVEPRPREEAAARALAAAMEQAGAVPLFHTLNDFYAAFVGHTNALTPVALLGLCRDAGMTSCAGKPAAISPIYARQPAPEYSSRVFAGDVPPITMRFFPQRFAYGAWVTSQTTTPRLKPAVLGGRAMAMPEDVAFALGSDRALEYFAQEMKQDLRQNLPATLEAVRQTMAAIKPTALDDTMFNNWLEGLMALSRTDLQPALPQVMRTASWHDRKLEATLASWTELRHDTILIVEQSTGGIGCQYPKGYVEPVPDLYRALSRSASLMSKLFAGGAYGLSNVAPCMDHWHATLEQLIALSDKELAGQAMTTADLDFLNQTADLHGFAYSGGRVYDGWYPQLFWTRMWAPTDPQGGHVDWMNAHPSGISEPIVADVHTDAENGQALEVATGHPGMMIVAIDNQGDISLYGGPASSYYSFAVPVSQRMTDEEWAAKVAWGNQPARPDFAAGYWAE